MGLKIPVTENISSATSSAFADSAASKEQVRPTDAASRLANDGTRALLHSGFWIVGFGLLTLLATETLFGGIGIHGAHTNAGWLALMFTLMSVPFGLMLLVLGGAKWLRNRAQNR